MDQKDKCRSESKKHHLCKNNYVWNPATCNCDNGKYLASIMDDSANICDEIIESYDDEINFNEKKQPAACQIPIFYLHFY